LVRSATTSAPARLVPSDEARIAQTQRSGTSSSNILRAWSFEKHHATAHHLLIVGAMTPFPHHYVVSLLDGSLTAPPRLPIALGPPPQFGGTDRVWSPEELLVGAVLECLWTTFEAFARRDKLVVRSWSGSGVGILDRAERVPSFTSIELLVHVVVDAGNEERGRALLAKAEDNCIISHALRVPVKVTATLDAYVDVAA
jgi:organic hydroperoxide reductase OsmC/OhrA